MQKDNFRRKWKAVLDEVPQSSEGAKGKYGVINNGNISTIN